MKIINLPAEANLIAFAGDIENQRNTNSCVANRDISAMEILLARAGKFENLSRLFHYWQLRKQQGKLAEDNGVKSKWSHMPLMSVGVCPESVWPFDVSRVFVEPSPEANAAATYRITGVQDVNTLDEIRAWIARGYPVLMAASVHPGFGNLRGKSLEETATIIRRDYLKRDNRAFSHALLIVGYRPDGWIIENSWGPQWGYAGYCLAPFDWFDAYCGDFQVFTGIEGIALADLWVPEYEKPKPAPRPTPKTFDKRHKFACALKMWLGRKCSCGAKP